MKKEQINIKKENARRIPNANSLYSLKNRELANEIHDINIIDNFFTFFARLTNKRNIIAIPNTITKILVVVEYDEIDIVNA
jgi:hypothetical protein